MDRGGQDSGPSPYEYLLAGLGACTAITVRLYCDRHNWNLRRAMVRVQHDKVLGSDGAPIDHFQRTIYLDGDLTEEQRRRRSPRAVLLARHCATVRSSTRPWPAPPRRFRGILHPISLVMGKSSFRGVPPWLAAARDPPNTYPQKNLNQKIKNKIAPRQRCGRSAGRTALVYIGEHCYGPSRP